MRNKFMKSSGGVIVSLAVILAIISLGCASFGTNAYTTVKVAVDVVDVSHTAYLAVFAAGKVSPELDATVAKDYAAYQASANSAVQGLLAYDAQVAAGATPDPTSINAILSGLQATIHSLLTSYTQVTKVTYNKVLFAKRVKLSVGSPSTLKVVNPNSLKLDPVTANLIIQILVTYGPQIYQQVVNLISASAPTTQNLIDLLTVINKPLHPVVVA